MTSLADLRSAFLAFFADRDHAVVPSSPLVPRNDPTLLFTNAGMVQFKNVFTGAEKRPYTKATSVQKCVRAGGKHNDLDNVGYTARHHTFFEMLGNFSFGDYFKEQAITFAWDFVTKTIDLPKDKLFVTVYPKDEEARGLWKKISGLSDDRIIGHESNLWAMGPVGPCGYCSEIFIDQGPSLWGGPPGSPEEDGDRFLEFWNLVFMQFEQVDENTRVELPRPSIDTGMGLERIAAILQGVTNNYDTDLFRHLIAASVEFSGARGNTDEIRASHRVIADHLRAASFLIAEGVLPSNEGRGYVLRRIMRRAMRHAHLIGSKDPLMYRLVPALVAEMGEAYPELPRGQALIVETLKLEESRFRETLARGLKLLDEATTTLGKGDTLDGETAFKLYDTYGFPLDLTQDALKARHIGVDVTGFTDAMNRQRAEARKAWAGSGEAATDTQWFALQDEFGKTEFLGYDTEEAEGTVLAILKDGERITSAKTGDTVLILTNQTPFYGESGGQVGDHGTVASPKAAGTVIDTEKKLGALHVHVVEVTKGEIAVGDSLDLKVDGERRRATRANHSATHLLQAALKRVLGPHVAQKGSLVGPEHLRFDFSHPKPVTAEELARVEDMVNAVIRQNSDVATRLMPTEQAISSGAMALFGEKYGDEVRVLTMGVDGDKPYSVELCGGTHVHRLGDIGLFTILSESAVASGVRRIEALTSEGARRYLAHQSELAREAAAALKTSPAELPARVAQLADERRRLERELTEARKALALAGPAQGGAESDVKEVGGLKLVARVVEGVSPKDLKGLADEAKTKIGSGVVAFVAVSDGKASIVVGVTDDLTKKVSAVDLVRTGAEALGGKGGGGRPDMAQAGGPDGTKAAAALAAIEAKLAAG
ncbi:alanine--tRNA ligase [Rhizomicrobium electricum]|jgi:alanyl-tRNA synthetase|uniref:Alanine--tRNA ligase n=1 Tax=Rhizomicrobium electricum TaxID=480070 RepID=A0ABN1U9J1_9PROT|nr:alanine--tRNA ligase [Rhizomicrobium electricum]NIJ49487.1 alanyl-tRNA synthetase [Rhizomicrobium electricum]